VKENTQELAKQTADQLLQEGIRPTQQNVRARMGCGSITTINKALNSWWQELGQRFKANAQHPMIPDPVAESASKLWVQALAYAEKSLEERRVELEQEYRRLKLESASGRNDDHEELKQLRAQCIRLLQDAEKNQAQKYELQFKVTEGEGCILSMQSEIDALKREVKQLKVLGAQGGLQEFIELQVANRSLKEENKRLNKQIDMLVSEKSSLTLEIARLEQDNQ